MDKQNFFDRCLLLKPSLIMSIGFVLIVIIGILGEYFSWDRIPFTPFSHFFGGVVILSGWILHQYCHRFHKKAHDQSRQIQSIVTSGPFSKIRHPMYLSLILMYLGIAIAWGVVWIFIPSILFSVLVVLIAIKEEKFLLQKLGCQYEDYMRQVPWRLIPKIF